MVFRDGGSLFVDVPEILPDVLGCNTAPKLFDITRRTHCNVVSIVQSQESECLDVVETVSSQGPAKRISSFLHIEN